MSDVLLISPPMASKGSNIYSPREPLGLYYLAGVLKANGISVSIIDFTMELLSRSILRQHITRLQPKIVGMTCYTQNFSIAREILNDIKNINPKIVTVLGGAHASELTKQVLESTPSIDFVVIGEGEMSFLDLCSNILNSGMANKINGIAFREDEKVIANPRRDLIKNLDDLPFPDRDLLPQEKYNLSLVQTSRGCPFGCIFCNVSASSGRQMRLRSPKKVADECSILVNHYKHTDLYFFGDTFSVNHNWTEEFCEDVMLRGLKFRWVCETRVDNVTLQLLRKMRQAGCWRIQYGIEYGDENVLRTLGKNTTPDNAINAVNWAHEAGMVVDGLFMFNVPGEDEQTIHKTLNLIQNLRLDGIEVTLLTPYPGTTLWNDMQRFGMRLTNYNFDNYTTKKYVMENINFPRERFVPEFLKILSYLKVYDIYTPEYPPKVYDIRNFLELDESKSQEKSKLGKTLNRIRHWDPLGNY
ncbi:MAG: Radical protein [Thermoproteota archaeon]|nr:Radical protein [Thermoproteota archaeon]